MPKTMEKIKFVEDCLFKGNVVHERYVPFKNKFKYKMVYFWLDVSSIKKLMLLKFDSFSIFSFNSKDFGCKRRMRFLTLFDYLQHEAKEIYKNEISNIKVLCLPRILHYSFNPISIFICYDRNKKAKLIFFEVRNTFGEKHAYISTLDKELMTSNKKFHVSPFLKNTGKYIFDFQITSKFVKLEIVYFINKKKILYASFNGQKEPLNDWNLAKIFFSRFYQNIKVTVGIHIEALKLWIKGAIYVKKPNPPKKFVSKIN